MSSITVLPRIPPSQLRGGLCHLFVLTSSALCLQCQGQAVSARAVLLGERKGILKQLRQVHLLLGSSSGHRWNGTDKPKPWHGNSKSPPSPLAACQHPSLQGTAPRWLLLFCFLSTLLINKAEEKIHTGTPEWFLTWLD